MTSRHLKCEGWVQKQTNFIGFSSNMQHSFLVCHVCQVVSNFSLPIKFINYLQEPIGKLQNYAGWNSLYSDLYEYYFLSMFKVSERIQPFIKSLWLEKLPNKNTRFWPTPKFISRNLCSLYFMYFMSDLHSLVIRCLFVSKNTKKCNF